MVSPVTVSGLALPLAVWPPGVAVTVYPVMFDPPLLVGTEKLTVAWPLPAVAEGLAGTPGALAGVTVLDGDDAVPVPAELVAVTVKV